MKSKTFFRIWACDGFRPSGAWFSSKRTVSFIQKFFDPNFFSKKFGRAPQSAKFLSALLFLVLFLLRLLDQEKKNKHTQTVSFTVTVGPLFLLTPSAQKRKAGRCLASQASPAKRKRHGSVSRSAERDQRRLP